MTHTVILTAVAVGTSYASWLHATDGKYLHAVLGVVITWCLSMGAVADVVLR